MSFSEGFYRTTQALNSLANNPGEQDRAERGIKIMENRDARENEDQAQKRKLRDIAEQYVRSFQQADPSELEGKTQGLDGDMGDAPVRRGLDMHSIPGLDRREFDGSIRTKSGLFTPDKLTQYRLDLAKQAMAMSNPAAMPDFEAKLQDRDFQLKVRDIGQWASHLKMNPSAAAAKFPQIAKLIDPASDIVSAAYDPQTKSIVAVNSKGETDQMSTEEMFRNAITFADPMKQYELSKMDLDMKGKQATIKNTEALTDLHERQADNVDENSAAIRDARRINAYANQKRADNSAAAMQQRAEKRKSDDAAYHNQWNALDKMNDHADKRYEFDSIGRNLMDANPELDGATASNLTYALAEGKIQPEVQQLGPLQVKTLGGNVYGVVGVTPKQERQLLKEIATPEGQAKLQKAQPAKPKAPVASPAQAAPRTALQPQPNRRAVEGKIKYAQ